MSVYFIGSADAKKIKVGYSKHPARRMAQMQPYCPVQLHLIGEVDQPPKFEARLHSYLIDHNAHGEWFHDHPFVVQTITAILDGTFNHDLLPKRGRRSWAWQRAAAA